MTFASISLDHLIKIHGQNGILCGVLENRYRRHLAAKICLPRAVRRCVSEIVEFCIHQSAQNAKYTHRNAANVTTLKEMSVAIVRSPLFIRSDDTTKWPGAVGTGGNNGAHTVTTGNRAHINTLEIGAKGCFCEFRDGRDQ